ncbi:MAG: tRNA dihydrouridine synthase DusB [Candidatus Marinimicrobia bacterium]|nr:tRNA dihydrouridine synthase DusB [Candidatus Neomarinimicrobiota bacterium]MBT6416965.1 tRNA dihydrouridine synthase DusB [Candidatus Neomarinimicrobiota bacterium]
MQIGNLNIETPILLAPMAGVTDYPFRVLCKEQGAGVVYSEFVSAHGIIRENAKTWQMIKFTVFERPIGIQIFGDSPEVMSRAARMIVDKFSPDILDINYGCPVPKITKRGAGSAALRDLCLMDDITSAVVESVPEVPVTVKMRAGWDSNSIVVPEVGPRLEKIGVKAIALHPRTTKQSYSGSADWTLIKALKESTSLPVIGNGDIKTPDHIMKMFDETGCDGVMVGRSALGNPWFFRDAVALYKGQPIPDQPSIYDKVACCKRHLNHMIDWHGERVGINLMRKHFGWYIRGFDGASPMRKALVSASEKEDMVSILDSIS